MAADTAAAWLSVTVTSVGLGSLMTQATAIREQMDPFHASRGVEHLGTWASRQVSLPWYRISKEPPVGPVITGKLHEGIGGINSIHVSRLPLDPPGKAGWTALLAVYHTSALSVSRGSHREQHFSLEPKQYQVVTIENTSTAQRDLSWNFLPTRPLVRHGSTCCTMISRVTLITLLSVSNARPIFRYSDASGHRAAYSSYCGQWHIEWPLGGAAVAHFSAHDSHTAAVDVYPPSFLRRVDKCIQLTAGVVVAPASDRFKCAFAGRKPPGRWVLEYQRKGFPGAHGSRHLYNMMGGKVFEIDFLFARRLLKDATPPEISLEFRLPSTEKDVEVVMYVPEAEQDVLAQAMDCLPWSSLSWSIHRGLRDILVAYAKATMDRHRKKLATRLREAVAQWPGNLEAKGWEASFVRESMADIAASSVLAGSGNSGDSVRVVTDVALLLWDGTTSALDETNFWREEQHSVKEDGWLSSQAIVALIKCFVLEWSNEFDYQMYHDLPMEILFG